MGKKNPLTEEPVKYLSSRFIMTATGISSRQLNYWASNGVFGEKFQVVSSGYRRPWTLNDIPKLIATKRFVDCVHSMCGPFSGVTIEFLTKFVFWLNENPDAKEVFVSFEGRVPKPVFRRVPNSPDYMRILLKGSAEHD